MRPDPLHPKRQNLDRVVAIASGLRDRVAGILAAGDRALVVGGDCTLTLGVVAAAVGRDPGTHLVYLDGDADLATPKSTRSGILDAMGIGHLLDLEGAAGPLAGLGGRRPLLSGRSLTMVGYEGEDLTESQANLLREHEVRSFPAAALRHDPDATVRAVLAGIPPGVPRIVHFDVDAVDSIDLPLAHYPHFNAGVSLATATRVLAGLCRPEGLVALVLTEVNPLHDPDRTELPRLLDMLVTAIAPLE
jgi:arginase